jgi:hypothetical protein
MILREATRLYLPRVVAEMEDDRSTERLGRSGITLYSCWNYVSPLHSDIDEEDGYCWCEEWRANRKTDDYAFVLASYGYYFATESNCLWYVEIQLCPWCLLTGLQGHLMVISLTPHFILRGNSVGW